MEGFFVSLYWFAAIAYLLVMWRVPIAFGHLADMPDFRLSGIHPKYRWLAWYLHITAAFMPLANVVLLCVTTYLVTRAFARHYRAARKD